ncbi:MAG: hypothetical protein R2882_11630 [Gemmatimonadales bacterium]
MDGARTADLAEARDALATALIEATYSPNNLPANLPAFETLVAAGTGEIWVERPAQRRGEPVQYVVLAQTGVPIARVQLPEGVRVTDAGRDYVVVVHRDEDGVETVRVYRLVRA